MRRCAWDHDNGVAVSRPDAVGVVLEAHHALPAAQVGIVHDLMLRELRLFTDCGRCCRPLFIVDLEAQRLAVSKDDIALLQDRESTNFGWSVGPQKPVHTATLHGCHPDGVKS